MHQLIFPAKKYFFPLLLALVFCACQGTKKTAAIPAPNFELESERGWVWINRPAIPEGGKAYTLFFETENRFVIHLDVNSCFGEYQKEAEQRISLPEYAACTEMCCDKETAPLFLEGFHAADHYAIHGDTLLLISSSQRMYFLPIDEEKE